MAFDWKKLEREDRDRADRGGKAMIIGYLTVGAVAIVLYLVVGYGRPESALMHLGFGLIMLVIWWYVSRRRSRRD